MLIWSTAVLPCNAKESLLTLTSVWTSSNSLSAFAALLQAFNVWLLMLTQQGSHRLVGTTCECSQQNSCHAAGMLLWSVVLHSCVTMPKQHHLKISHTNLVTSLLLCCRSAAVVHWPAPAWEAPAGRGSLRSVGQHEAPFCRSGPTVCGLSAEKLLQVGHSQDLL